MSVAANLSSVKKSLGKCTLVAVSKKKSADLIREAHAAGHHHFGENYLQDAEPKIKELADCDIVWHFIGQLQSNKVKKVVELFDVIQTVDSQKLVDAIDKHAAKLNKHQMIMIQTYQGSEENRGGCAMEAVGSLAQYIKTKKNLLLIGVMCMTPDVPLEERRNYFRIGKSAFDDAKEKCPDTVEALSMGMSDDYEMAMEEGSNMIRIGTKVFGAR